MREIMYLAADTGEMTVLYAPDSKSTEAERETQLAAAARQKFGENAVEALVGALSSAVGTERLQVLLKAWSAQ
jgi:hypothetical protein